MITAVVDTNIIVAGVITKNPRSASMRLLDLLFAQEFETLLSEPALTEIQDVLCLPRMKAVHDLSDNDIQRFCRALVVRSRLLTGTVVVSPATTRDVSDTKWVALAIEGNADYLVTHDRRHLGRLKTK